jgi:hypothetical protein
MVFYTNKCFIVYTGYNLHNSQQGDCWTATTTTTSTSGNSGGPLVAAIETAGKEGGEGMMRARDRRVSSLVSVCFFIFIY